MALKLSKKDTNENIFVTPAEAFEGHLYEIVKFPCDEHIGKVVAMMGSRMILVNDFDSWNSRREFADKNKYLLRKFQKGEFITLTQE